MDKFDLEKTTGPASSGQSQGEIPNRREKMILIQTSLSREYGFVKQMRAEPSSFSDLLQFFYYYNHPKMSYHFNDYSLLIGLYLFHIPTDLGLVSGGTARYHFGNITCTFKKKLTENLQKKNISFFKNSC